MPVTRLAQGHRLAALDALAAQVSTEEHTFVPTNPASVDARHRLVRLRLPKGGLPYRNETVAYLVDDEPRARFGPAQDPRGIWLGSDLLVFYSRVMNAGAMINVRPAHVSMAMRNMSEPNREVILREPSDATPVAKFMSWEKNWTPFIHEGRLYLSYRLEPHVVLRCNWQTGGCTVAHRTNSTAVWAHQRTSVRMGARGGSPAVHLRSVGSYVGIAHFRNPSGIYDHCLYEFEDRPPFAMLRSSQRFMFNSSDRIQFVAGMYKHHDELVVSYGASDIASWESELPIARALELLGSPRSTSRGSSSSYYGGSSGVAMHPH